MSITMCKYCEFQHDTDFDAEHEEICEEKHAKAILKKHYQRIGALGGAKSKRVLTSEQAKAMVRAREAKKQELH